jgi:hypothetical protein
MTPDEEIYRANRAKEVLENEVYIDTFKKLEEELRTAWETSPARDKEGRELLWLTLGQLRRVQAMLEHTMASGKLKAQDLAHKQARAKKAQAWSE